MRALDIRDHPAVGTVHENEIQRDGAVVVIRQQRHGWRREVTNARSARQHDRIEKPLIPRHKLTRYTYKSGPGATRTMAEIAR